MRLTQIFATYDWRRNSGIEGFKYCPLCATPFVFRETAQKLRPACPDCGFVYFRNPFPTVSVLVLKDDHVLLGRRLAEPGKGKWGLPSGYIEFEDDFLTAAVREVREETGLDVQIRSILNVQSAFLPPDYHFLGVYLLGTLVGGELRAGDDLEAVDWFPLSGPLPEMAFQPDVDIIEAYAQAEIEGLPVNNGSQNL
jgi:8-oxo-dGTP diphosphatase